MNYNPANEPVLSYLPGSKERSSLKAAIAEARSKVIEIPMFIGGKEVFTGNKKSIRPPHDHKHLLGYFHEGGKKEVDLAIAAALAAKENWMSTPTEDRARIFLKAAELIAGPYRARLNAATMLGQSKNVYQAEIDSACEMIDFLRFNVKFMLDIQSIQPGSSEGVKNWMEYRPLEGFVFALTPFNFTAIAGNLPSAPALMGNVVVWKPAYTQIYSAHVLMEIFREAGLPDGVINMVFADGPVAGESIFNHRDFAGIHFTGSTGVFKNIWKQISDNLDKYKTYPRIVAETGGKDFVLAHESANAKALAVALVRGAFEYQGQKCSAASRAYVPASIWPEVKKYILEDIKSFKIGGVEDFSNFMNAVIDERAFNKIKGFLDEAKSSKEVEVLVGGNYNSMKGYFIEPTVLVAKSPQYRTMCEEIFGPVLSVYVYNESFEEILKVVENTSPYGLTGSIFAQDNNIVDYASKKLINAAGNFYINDKPTGAVVNQQPFGGGRLSGTNDKAGSLLNLIRWTSPRAVKQNLNPPIDYRYPFMDEE